MARVSGPPVAARAGIGGPDNKPGHDETCQLRVSSHGENALGYMYAKGDGVEPNRQKAREFLDKACSNGHLYTQRILAIL
jgi:TPR repeat protein